MRAAAAAADRRPADRLHQGERRRASPARRSRAADHGAASAPQAWRRRSPVDPAEVQKRFDFRKDSLSTPETRTLVQIPAKDAAAAAARRRPPAPRARTPPPSPRPLGVEPVTYTDSPRPRSPTARSPTPPSPCSAGEVRGPSRASSAWPWSRSTAITPGHAVDAGGGPRRASRPRSARTPPPSRSTSQVQKYEDARSGGANLADAAKGRRATPIAVRRRSPPRAPTLQRPADPACRRRCCEAAFDLPAGRRERRRRTPARASTSPCASTRSYPPPCRPGRGRAAADPGLHAARSCASA